MDIRVNLYCFQFIAYQANFGVCKSDGLKSRASFYSLLISVQRLQPFKLLSLPSLREECGASLPRCQHCTLNRDHARLFVPGFV